MADMASIEDRTRGDGTTAYRVVWREHNTKQSETFSAKREATRFRGMVDAAGQAWPKGWIAGHGMPGDSAGTLTVEAWTRRAIAARTGISDGTRAKYLKLLEQHVWPAIGHEALDALDQEGAARWHNGLIKTDGTKLSPKTRANIHGLLSSCYQQAVQARHVDHNPLHGMTLDRAESVGREEMVALTVGQFDLLLTQIPGPYRLLVRFLARTGLRWGEATALQARHLIVSDTKVRVNVWQAWKPTPGGGMELGPPKTKRSRRTITIRPATLADDMVALAAGKAAEDLLFTSPRGYALRNGTFWTRVWGPAMDSLNDPRRNGDGTPDAPVLGMRPRIHDLRHTHVSWLIDAGIDSRRIQQRLGHESITTTIDRYGHLFPNDDTDLEGALHEGTNASVTPLRAVRSR